MPPNMVIFERLAYGFLALHILAGMLTGMTVRDTTDVAIYLIVAVLIWAAARKRKNWAR